MNDIREQMQNILIRMKKILPDTSYDSNGRVVDGFYFPNKELAEKFCYENNEKVISEYPYAVQRFMDSIYAIVSHINILVKFCNNIGNSKELLNIFYDNRKFDFKVSKPETNKISTLRNENINVNIYEIEFLGTSDPNGNENNEWKDTNSIPLEIKFVLVEYVFRDENSYQLFPSFLKDEVGLNKILGCIKIQ